MIFYPGHLVSVDGCPGCPLLGLHVLAGVVPSGYYEPGVASRIRGESGGVSNNELITELKEVALEHVRDNHYVFLGVTPSQRTNAPSHPSPAASETLSIR